MAARRALRIPVVILCGGKGTRVHEETEFRPKPLIDIGGKPILWHIMKIFASAGARDFILCLGYKGDQIRRYFLEYELMESSVTLDFRSRSRDRRLVFHDRPAEDDWRITFVNTGLSANTGARIKRIEPFVRADRFFMTYGDGVANIDVAKLHDFHVSHGRIATVTGVRPASRFGDLVVEGDSVTEFSEKRQTRQGYINGGFFVMENRIFDYLEDVDACMFEGPPLERLASDGELMMHRLHTFWHCLDTYRDKEALEDLWRSGKADWKVWKDRE
jgi:glucose-1-phosphate cytidylyltransferase